MAHENKSERRAAIADLKKKGAPKSMLDISVSVSVKEDKNEKEGMMCHAYDSIEHHKERRDRLEKKLGAAKKELAALDKDRVFDIVKTMLEADILTMQGEHDGLEKKLSGMSAA